MHMPKVAQACPACGEGLQIERLHCRACDTVVEGRFRWPRLARLPRDDQHLVELLILSSGSLKGLARRLGVSYPTVRKRLDALIEKLAEEVDADEGYRRELLDDLEARRRSPADVVERIEE